MKLNSWPKLLSALAGILVGLYLPEIWAFLQSLFS